MIDQVGMQKPIRPIVSKVYIGNNEKLNLKKALVGGNKSEHCVSAQFDDISTSYGYGWWIFNESDFMTEDEIIERLLA